jgi:hypothetical protein
MLQRLQPRNKLIAEQKNLRATNEGKAGRTYFSKYTKTDW